ncbi:L,D-transpeptidase family protein [Geosporobacter ferrireducens]|uniref:L,D-transpeptidase family protein n=1 Tax=Geosporobacter ferrireducens TaxID=1424294 RepID=UPI000B056408|nr:L,D-transpeptidase family protein [Geosporobacter ferrireducens]
MGKKLLRTVAYTILIVVIFLAGSLFSYTVSRMEFDIPIKISRKNEYVSWEEKVMKENPDYPNLVIFVDVNSNILELINLDDNSILKKYPIASGKKGTPSPIGSWMVIGKSKWGKGFGTRWMGLNVPWGKYGIHGTNKPHSIGQDASHGCIRMRNKDVEDLYKYVKVGDSVVIWGGVFGPFGNGFRVLSPGDRGSDVFEVQKRMKRIGYYPGRIDGIYGEGMKSHVIKFRRDKELPLTHNIDFEFYNALDIILFE